jgi:hypothetical protein
MKEACYKSLFLYSDKMILEFECKLKGFNFYQEKFIFGHYFYAFRKTCTVEIYRFDFLGYF